MDIQGLDKLSAMDLIFQHRVASGEWTRLHAEAYAQDENGNYIHWDTTKFDALMSKLNDAMDLTTAIEKELGRRLGS